MHLRNYTLHPQEMEGENFQMTMVFCSYSRWSIESNAIAPKLWIPSNAGVVFFQILPNFGYKFSCDSWSRERLKRLNCCPITCFEKTSDVQVIIGVLLAAAFYFRQPAGPEEQALRLQEVEIPVTCWKFKALSPCPFYFASCCLVFVTIECKLLYKKDLVHIGISSTSGFGWVLKSWSNANKEEWDFGLEKGPFLPVFSNGYTHIK